MISTAMKNAGAVVVTPPAVGTCSAEERRYPGSAAVATLRPATTGPVVDATAVLAPVRELGLPVVGTGGADAPIEGTGLPTAVLSVRLRGIAAAGSTGFDTTGVAPATTVQLHSSTPGDLPPEDPPS